MVQVTNARSSEMSNMIKVCMVTTLFPKSNYAQFLAESFQAELEDRVEMVYYTSRNEKAVESNIPPGKVKHVWSSNVLYPFQIFREALHDRPHMVHVQHEFTMYGGLMTTVVFPFLILLLRLARMKVVLTVHLIVPLRLVNGDFLKTFQFQQSKLLATVAKLGLTAFYRIVASLASGIIVHANCLGSILVSDYNINESKVFVIPVGVSERVNNSSRQGRWRDFLKNRNVILFFGLLTERKGIEYLIEAFEDIAKIHPHWVLVLAGKCGDIYGWKHASYGGQLKNMINEKKLMQHVILTGFISEEEIHELYDISEIVVLPYTYQLGGSLCLSFAIQHHKPIIVTDVGTFREEITDGKEGVLVPPKDYLALKKALTRLITNAKLREELSEQIQAKAEERSWNQVAQRTYELYQKIVRG